jgi:1,4-dihydroxy-6-naphthoate synthase
MSAAKIRLGISTCPNDTWAFHGLMNRCIDWRGLDFEVDLRDVEELNQRLFRGEYEVAKASFHAALYLSANYLVLPSGSALGFGVGPLLLSRHRDISPATAVAGRCEVLCPGAMTTATLLYRLFYPDCGTIRQVVFSEIMPRLAEGDGDFGVCIHEGRFTWRESGLFLVEDLGERWERTTGQPLPLGGILAARSLGKDILWRVQQVIADSLDYAAAHPDEALATMRRFAQEFSDEVLMQHVRLYVNEQTRDLGSAGREALGELSRRGKAAGITGDGMPQLEVL